MIDSLKQKIQSATNTFELARDHALLGFIQNNEWDNETKKIKYRNTILLEVAQQIQKSFPDIIFLKGIGLIGELYEDIAERFMADIDLLIQNEKSKDLFQEYIVNKIEFEDITERTWIGNDFKKEYQKTIEGVDIVIEVHERLFFHHENKNYPSFLNINELRILEHELNLVHICGHLGFQHNFLKIYWLIDVYKYSLKKLDLNLVYKYAQEQKVSTSTKVALSLVGLDIKLSLKEKLCKYLLNENFLLYPNRRSLRYIVLKILLKDDLKTSLKYFTSWLLNRRVKSA